MNRRQFFGMTAAAVAAAGLSPLVLPEKTLFLPPRWGWKPSQLGVGYMREVSQYLINFDEMGYRYDAIGRDIWGTEHQLHITLKSDHLTGVVRPDPAVASHALSSMMERHGLSAVPVGQSRQFRLELPQPLGCQARYV